VIVTALDLARVSGVAFGPPFAQPTFQTWTLGEVGSPLGERGCELLRRLNDHLARIEPARVYVEAPMRPRIAVGKDGGNAATALQLNGLVFLALTVCWSRRVPTVMLDRRPALKHFTGQAGYKDRDAAKRACKARIRQLWRVDVGLDEADAGALLDYGCSLDNPKAFMQSRMSQPPMNRTGAM
jgi:hypothetical protein